MTDCSCRALMIGGKRVPEIPDVDCPLHGLPGNTKFEPMDRHARRLPCTAHAPKASIGCPACRRETAREVQLRLYHEARGTA
jgi:hypothetical protein